MERIGGAALTDDVILTVYFVVPGTAMPMIVPDKVEYPAALHIQRDIPVRRKLIEEVGGIRGFVSAAAIIGASHVSPHADSLVGPTIPHSVGIVTDRDRGRFGAGKHAKQEEKTESGIHRRSQPEFIEYTLSFHESSRLDLNRYDLNVYYVMIQQDCSK